jgi:hypothetical protein
LPSRLTRYDCHSVHLKKDSTDDCAQAENHPIGTYNSGCRLQAAQKTNDIAGDGTTTATILSAAIIAEGMKIVAAGTNPVQLTRGIEKTVAALVKDLAKMSTDVTDDDLINVATVSAGGNEVVRPPSPTPLLPYPTSC